MKNKTNVKYCYEMKWRRVNQEKVKAHRKVFCALRNKTLQKGICQICGSEKVEAHHEDYTKPLQVIWYCRKHHLEFHKNMAI